VNVLQPSAYHSFKGSDAELGDELFDELNQAVGDEPEPPWKISNQIRILSTFLDHRRCC
jgi:hypothetical protein